MAVSDDTKQLEEAERVKKESPATAEKIYKDILSKSPGQSDKQIRVFENALVGLGELLRDQKRAQDLTNLINQTRDVLTSFARAKTAKLGTTTSI